MLRWSQTVIDAADGDPSKGNFIVPSPLAVAFTMRAIAEYCLGRPGWREDLRQCLAMARRSTPFLCRGSSTSSISRGYCRVSSAPMIVRCARSEEP